MPQWAAFVGLTGFLLTVLLGLSRLSQRQLSDDRAAVTTRADGLERLQRAGPADDTYPRFEGRHAARRRRQLEAQRARDGLSTGTLLANVALTQGLFGVLLIGGAFFFEIPPSALGLTGSALSTGAVGVGAGVGFWVGNEFAAAVADSFDIAVDESFRALLAPDSPVGWLLLFCVVLPIIAVVEELLFRAAAIGVPVAGLGAPAWAMVPLSSVAFALGHGAQGRVGVLVTGVLGAALGALFVATDSLLAVVIAHYLVNALELGVHEGLGVDRLILSAVRS